MTKNFCELVTMVAENHDFRDLYVLGLYLQGIDNMLWNGFPHIYANYRTLLEGIINFMLKKDCMINIESGGNAQSKTQKEFDDWVNCVRRGELSWDDLKGTTVFIERDDCCKFHHKINLVESYCKHVKYDISRWRLHDQRKTLNTLVHQIGMPRDTELGFRQRFQLIKSFHDVIYSDFIRMHANCMVSDYSFPNDEELKEIANLYNSRIAI